MSTTTQYKLNTLGQSVTTFHGSKLTVDEINCECGTNICFKPTCLNKYRFFNSDRENIELLKVSRTDLSLKNSNIFVGNVNKDFQQLLFLLKDAIIPNSSNSNIIENLISHLKTKNNLSKIGSLKDKSYTVNPLYRKSLSHNINQEHTKKLGDLLLPTLIECYKKKTNLPVLSNDIIIHPTHSNVVFYPGESKTDESSESGGFFKTHIDKILNFPQVDENLDSDDYQMFSLVLCLDSKVNKNTMEGCTIVHLPPFDVQDFYINPFESKDFKFDDFNCIPHVFNEGIIPGEFLAFPSNARHSSEKIESQDGYKLILKMDFWVYSTSYPYSLKVNYLLTKGLDLTPDNPISIKKIRDTFFNCDCMLCNPFRKIIPTITYNIFESETPIYLGSDIIKIIFNYLGDSEINLDDYEDYYKNNRFDYHKYLPPYFLELENDPSKLTDLIYSYRMDYEMDYYSMNYSDHDDDYYDYYDYENNNICNGDDEDYF
tara:strand:- start:417 stop:1874 length:1458 start_codon:yes stop_codon:yes gene_type:complete